MKFVTARSKGAGPLLAALAAFLAGGAANAQFTLRTDPASVAAPAGGTVALKVYLDASPPSGHNFATARAFLAYSQDGTSPFSSATFTPSPDNGGFSAAAPGLTGADVAAGPYRGLSLLFANSAGRTQAGTFLLGTLTGRLRPDLAANTTLTLRFVDAPGTAARTRVLGDATYATTLGTTTLSISGAGIPGDVDGNGIFNLQDVALALQAAAGLQAANAGERQRGDLNADGALTLADAALLLRRLNGN